MGVSSERSTRHLRFSKNLTVSAAVTLLVAWAQVSAYGRTTAQPLLPNTDVVEAEKPCSDAAFSVAATSLSEGEPSLRDLPSDPRRAVAAWTQAGATSSPPKGQQNGPGIQNAVEGSVVLGQRDRFGHWTQQTVAQQNDDRFYGKAWLDFGPNGVAYLSYVDSERNAGLHKITPGSSAGPDLKPPMVAEQLTVAVDQRVFAEGDRIYLVSHRGLKESKDSGGSWGPLVPVGIDMVGPTVATGGDQVLVSWRPLGSAVLRVAVYDEQQGRVTQRTTIPAHVPMYGGDDPFGAYTIPSLTVVRSGSLTGAAYLTWADKESADAQPDVFASASYDGLHWSQPVKVNDDRDATDFQVYPSVAATYQGQGIIAWLDSRNSEQGQVLPVDQTFTASAQLFATTAKISGSEDQPRLTVGKNHQLTQCPTYDESFLAPNSNTYGDYFNFDASQGKVDLIFPQIRKPQSDSDIYGLAPAPK